MNFCMMACQLRFKSQQIIWLKRILIILPLIFFLGCMSESTEVTKATKNTKATKTTLCGKVSLPGLQTLPKPSTMTITLADVSLADAPMQELARVSYVSPQNLPLLFSIQYDLSLIKPGHSYAVSARLFSNTGSLLWISDQRYSVNGTDRPSMIEMVLKKIE